MFWEMCKWWITDKWLYGLKKICISVNHRNIAGVKHLFKQYSATTQSPIPRYIAKNIPLSAVANERLKLFFPFVSNGIFLLG